MIVSILLQSTVPALAVSKTAESFGKYDPWGVAMAIIAMSVVFCALILLFVSFKYIGFAFTTDWKRRALIKEGKIEEAQHIENSATGELNAAIGLALYLYKSELHDIESLNLTINKVSRNYSPWSSKIYGLRQIQNKIW
jgi:glutaconyl-CoA/methylmalonyl-CoA decarboxylase subunit delta